MEKQKMLCNIISPLVLKIARLVLNDLGAPDGQQNIIFDHTTDDLKRISELHQSSMALQHPILFPYGEDGYGLSIRY